MVGCGVNIDVDPKHNTAAQRSWIPSEDQSIRYGGGKGVGEFRGTGMGRGEGGVNDIQTSTNVNEGMHSIHPKEVGVGYYRHVRQDVTRVENKTPATR